MPKVPKRPDMNDPTQMATGLYNQGIKAGPDGQMMPTQDFGGMMSKASQGVNSLSRGVKGGTFSNLGKPLNTMHEQNPGFFNRGGNAGGVEGFSQMLAQRGQQTAPAAQKPLPDDTPGAASTAARAQAFGKPKLGTPTTLPNSQLIKSASATPPTGPSPTELNRQALEQGAAGLKLQRQASGEAPTVTTSGGVRSISGKYGSGTATHTPTTEGMVNSRPFSEVMQGLANKPGIAREGDTFQPETGGNALYSKASGVPVKSARDLMKGAPTKKPFTTAPMNNGKQMLAAAKRKPLARA